jgi:hypothetical protein
MTRAPFPDTLPWHARSDPNHGREIRLSFAMRLQKKPQAVSQGNISSKVSIHVDIFVGRRTQ